MIGDNYQFKMVDGRDCENPNGAWIFVGKVDGSELHDPDVLSGQAELRVMQDKFGALAATMRVYGQELTTLVNQRNLDVDQMGVSSKKRCWTAMKNIVVISKGAGGGSAEVLADQQN